MSKYKDFPEFERTVPEVIVISENYLDEQHELARREKRVQWKERKEGRMAGKTTTKRGWYPPEKRIQIATAFVAGMTNATDLERLSGVSASAIRNWKQKDWWADLIERVRREQDEVIDAKFTKIIDKTLDTIVDRLEGGDYKMDRFGELHRVPVGMKDAASVATSVVDKRNLLRGKPTSRTERLSDKDQLANLAKEFRKFAGAKQIEGEVIPITEGDDYESQPIPLESGEEGGRDLRQVFQEDQAYEGPESEGQEGDAGDWGSEESSRSTGEEAQEAGGHLVEARQASD